MPELQIRLFGKFSAMYADRDVADLTSARVQELLSYLLLNHGRQHPRETLAGRLWSESTDVQAKKYLRQALWQLQNALDTGDAASRRLLEVDAGWLSLSQDARLWVDTSVFERAYATVQGVPGRMIDAGRARTLQEAVKLYRGDLLEGWYQDWCLYERERLQTAYLAMLDKLAAYCESQGQYEAGLAYATVALRYDRADERTHRRLMALHYHLGDRTAALRQYDRCRDALQQELGVRPSQLTDRLLDQIRRDKLMSASQPDPAATANGTVPAPFARTLARLAQLQDLVTDIQHEVQRDVLEAGGILPGGQ